MYTIKRFYFSLAPHPPPSKRRPKLHRLRVPTLHLALLAFYVQHVLQLVLAHALLKKVRLARERAHFHKVERVGLVPHLVVAQLGQQAVGDVLNVVAHQVWENDTMHPVV